MVIKIDVFLKEKKLMSEKQQPYFNILRNGVRVTFPMDQNSMDALEKFELKESDVFIVSYPKSGTTLTQQMVRLIAGMKLDCPITDVIPWIEEDFAHPEKVDKLQHMSSPRYFKSHTPWNMIRKGKGVRYIYIARDGRDVAVSLFHHMHGFTLYNYCESWEDFFPLFIRGETEWGSWFEHVKEFWLRRNEENVLFIRYEDLLRNAESSVEQVAKFLGYSLTHERCCEIAKKINFDAMKKDATVNYQWSRSLRSDFSFIRKGLPGEWKEFFTPAQEKQFDELYSQVIGSDSRCYEFKL